MKMKIIIIALLSILIIILLLAVFNLRNQNSKNIFFNPSPTSKPKIISPFLEARGTKLYLFDQPYTFTGVNAYYAASFYGHNSGCGGMIENPDKFFSSLRPNSIVRMWAYQGTMAINPKTRKLDWAGLDRVIKSAQNNNQRLILVLGDQSGTCDDSLWKDQNWYAGGFMNIYNPKGFHPYSYIDYVKEVANRYKNSTAIAMWELINEPEASTCDPGHSGTACYKFQSCPDAKAAANSLRYFFDTVGGEIKKIDKNHLISSGVIGNGQCGAIYHDYKYIHESPSIDVASYHDYDSPDIAMPGDQWNGLQFRLAQMKSINKPLFVGEAGMLAQDNLPNCITLWERHNKMKAKLDAQFAAGIAGFLIWSWSGSNGGTCNYDAYPSDPLLSLIYSYPVAEITPLYTPTPTHSTKPDNSFTPGISVIN